MSNKNILELMLKEYGNFCWLGGVVTNSNYLTYHHITKQKGEKGDDTPANGALLSKKMHVLLNLLEGTTEFKYINLMFECYNVTKNPFYLELARTVFKSTINEYMERKNSSRIQKSRKFLD